MMLRRAGFAVVTGLSLAWALGASAEARALLIGVSDYENELSGLNDLRGPVNDIRLMRDVLGARGVSDIRVLADGVDGGTRPRRAAILAAFRKMADDAEPGDFVYLHFSGHGTRQPDPEGDETDGLDEVFLASDAGRADAGSGRIPGAIIDDDLGRAVAAIRAKGADVWLVIDSCNSGTGLRAAGSGTAARYVDPAALGVSVSAARSPDAALADTAQPDLPGGYLAFYAAQSSELAREVDFDEGEGEAWYGLFTARLAARLADGGAQSFRQLFQGVIRDLYDTDLPGVARLQTPAWEGTLIDAAVFGGEATAGIRRYRVRGDEIEAGLVHGLAEGTLVGLVDDAAAPPDAILGFAQMELVEATRGFLRPVAAECEPRVAVPCPAVGGMPEGAAFAQVVARPLDLIVWLAAPTDMAGVPLSADAAPMAALRAAAEAARAAGHGIEIAAPAWDVQVLWDGEALWFGPRAEIGGTPVGLSWVPGAEPLAPLLVRISQAETLARVLAAVAGEANPLNPSPVTLSAQLTSVNIADLAPPERPTAPARECRRALAGAGPPLALAPGAELKQCDTVSFAVEGDIQGARDVNRVYIDAAYCLRVDHELVEGTRRPRRLGPDMTLCSECPGGYGAGEERMFVIVTEVAENAEPLNLEGLLDNCSGSGATRGTAGRSALEFLAATARRPGTRGSFGGFGAANIWVEALNWRILPRSEALARFGPRASAE